MVSQISWHLNEHNILLRNQHGFRNGLSCETQLLEFVQELHESQHAWVQIDAIVMENVRKLEMVQRLGARWVLGRYHNRSSVTSMLEKLNWRSLEQCRVDSRLVMLYKMANSLVTIDAYPLLVPMEGIQHSAHPHRYMVPTTRTVLHQNSFFPQNYQAVEFSAIQCCPSLITWCLQAPSELATTLRVAHFSLFFPSYQHTIYSLPLTFPLPINLNFLSSSFPVSCCSLSLFLLTY